MRNPSMPIVCCTVFIGGLCFSVTSVGTCYAAGMAPALLATSATLLNLACLFFGRTPDDDEPPSEPGPPLPLYISYLAGLLDTILGYNYGLRGNSWYIRTPQLAWTMNAAHV